MGLRVFVTRELFPFTPGGIGRVLSNILWNEPGETRDSMAVLYIGDSIDNGAFEQVFPGVKFLAWPHHCYLTRTRSGEWFPPQASFSHCLLYWESIHVAQGLDELTLTHGEPEYIEFIDWGAAAFVATQRKALGIALCSSILAVRLHTTDSILADFEPRKQDSSGLALYDLERKALADCDLIVGQLATVANAFKFFYGFNEHEWDPRLRLHAPPVLLDTCPVAVSTIDVGTATPLLFTSKLQDIKRPDVFVRGCVQFMRRCPAYQGDVVFLAHSFDAAYMTHVEDLIPDELRKRVIFTKGVSGVARERRIAKSVCIFPSPWESFCLAAHEASLSGAVCILNDSNPAFGDGTPWQAGFNCEKFDGTAEGLAAALERLFANGSTDLVPVAVSPDPEPWKELPKPVVRPTAAHPCIDVVIINRNSGLGLLRTLDSVLSSGASLGALVIVDDASTDPRDLSVLDELASAEGIVVLRSDTPSGVATASNRGLGATCSDSVAFVRAGDRFVAGFLETSAAALQNCSEFDVVVGQAIISDAEDMPPIEISVLAGIEAHPSLFRIYYGEATLSGLYEDRFSPTGFIVRREVALNHRFDPTMQAMEVWEFMMRIGQAGSRFLVAPTVGLVLSSRGPVVDESFSFLRTQALRRRLHGKRARIGRMDVPAYFVFDRIDSPLLSGIDQAGMSPSVGSADAHEKLKELMEAESVRYSLALVHILQRRAPWLLRFGKWTARKALPLYRHLLR